MTIVNLSNQDGRRRRHVVKTDAAKQLMQASPAQIKTYIENNANDLDSARDTLILLAQIVSVLARREFTEWDDE